MALETKLGWVLSGPAAVPVLTESCTVNLSATHVLKIESADISHVQDDLQKFWDLETLGIRDNETSVYDKFSNEIKFTGERYQVKLPFKDNHPMLSDNYTNASRRLTTVIKKLKTQPEILEQYHQVIKEQLESGVAEEVRQDQVLEPGNVHYLPHRGVVRLDRDTTKVRVVYDASSKVFGPSLNDCLHVGPSLNPLLLDILLRFRVHEVAVTADIEKAFLNIEIDPGHRDFLRFLWVDDVNKESPEIKLLRFTRVVFGVNASPFILNATIRHHVNTYMLNDDAFALELLKSLYVDDFVSGAKDVNNALSLSKEMKLCLKSGGFNMRKWNSNSASLLQSLKQDSAFVGDFAINSKECVQEEYESFSKSVFKQDASEKAYGAVVYMRAEYESRVECEIVASKTRVAPLDKQTIPRLELLSTLTASRLAKSVSQALENVVRVDDVVNWTDSMISLWWIRNTDKEYKQFVENRVSEIRRNAPPEQWRYCPTSENPADIASRGIKATALKESSLWLHGPEFLSKESAYWPVQPVNVQAKEELCELKSAKPTVSSLLNTCTEKEANLESIINPESYSSLTKLIRVTSLVLLFVKKLKRRRDGSSDQEESLQVYKQAEKKWIKHVQKGILNSDKYQQMKSTLGLYQDSEGVVRCQGRIGLSSLPYDTKFPVLLPREHCFTRLVILKCHEQVMHNGVAETLVQLRSKYWVVKGRQTVKKILSKCVVCKKLKGRPYGVPPTPQLPEFILSDDFAFSSIGVDFAGPIYVKDVYNKSSVMNKAYIVLYTCASSRAVHLDLVPNMSTQAFVRSFKRFTARRGVPRLFVSDNGSAFKSEELKRLLAEYSISWKYNVALAPWWGGFFERLVKSTKRCLKKILGTARVTYEELLTIIVETEGILNSRPLTYVSDEMRDPLTPSQLVIGRRLLSSPGSAKQPSGGDHTVRDLSRREKYLNAVLSHFWKRWQKEYLTELRVHHNCNSSNRKPTIKVGDVVCVYKDKAPRQLWSMGVVKSLITGRDGYHRGAVVRVRSGDRVVEMTRPLNRLYPVEVESQVREERQNRNTDFPITFVGNAEQEHVSEH